MTRSNEIAALAVIAGLAAGSPALAQTQPDPHHPPGSAGAQQSPPGVQPPAGQGPTPGMTGSPGMMVQGAGMPMMGMMNMMGLGGMGMHEMGMHGMDMPGIATIERVEGRIAFLRTELKITDAQGKMWSDFAQALRDNAKRLAGARASAPNPTGAPTPSLAQRLDGQERWLAARLDGVQAIRTAFVPLYDSLAAEQRKSADELLGSHMGLMPLGMMSMGMMPAQGGRP